MELSEQVVSRDLAKQLLDLGVPDNSQFFWAEKDFIVSYNRETNKHEVTQTKWYLHANSSFTYFGDCKIILPAFTVSELIKFLPRIIKDDIEDKDSFYYLMIKWEHDFPDPNYYWEIQYYKQYYDIKDFIFSDVILENALAKMLIYLLEKNLIKAEDLKS